jgi:hypothetical protein
MGYKLWLLASSSKRINTDKKITSENNMFRNLVDGFRIIRFDTFLMQVISLTTGKMEAYSWKIAELVLNNNHSLDDCVLSLYFVLYRFVSNQIDVYEYIEKVNASFCAISLEKVHG